MPADIWPVCYSWACHRSSTARFDTLASQRLFLPCGQVSMSQTVYKCHAWNLANFLFFSNSDCNYPMRLQLCLYHGSSSVAICTKLLLHCKINICHIKAAYIFYRVQITQRAHNAIITSSLRPNDVANVVLTQWRRYHCVIIASCVRWVWAHQLFMKWVPKAALVSFLGEITLNHRHLQIIL